MLISAGKSRMLVCIRLFLINIAILLGVGVLAACQTDGRDGVVPNDNAPTRTLVPPTLTPTTRFVSPTPTPTNVPPPSTMVAVSTAAPVAYIPDTAQAQIDRAMTDLVSEYDVVLDDIRLLSLEAFVWHDASWGCQARLEAGFSGPVSTRGYRIVFGVGSRVYVYHADEDSTIFLCDDRGWLDLTGQPIPLDPIAESMVDLAQRDAARRLDVAQVDVKLAGLVATTWPDAGLGCPQTSEDYEAEPTLGYRIVFQVGDEMLIYHTSIREIVLCAPDEEILPGALRRAIPSPTP